MDSGIRLKRFYLVDLNRVSIGVLSGVIASVVTGIGARTFRDAYIGMIDLEDLERFIEPNFSPAKVEAELRDPAATFPLAHENRRAIGYVKLSASESPTSVTGSAPIELERIYIDQAAIGMGYGSALMRAFLQEARRAGCETIWLGVWEENERAIRFYEKWGFRAVGTQRFVLGSKVQTDIVMTPQVE